MNTLKFKCKRCGVTKIAKYPSQVRIFCSRNCCKIFRFGIHGPRWSGGKTINGCGYVRIYCPEHPNHIQRYVVEHRLVMEKHLCRYLEPHEIVHHINGIKTDNRLENLILTNRAEHASHHHKNTRKKKCNKCDVFFQINNTKHLC
jgi:hypothetical protein